LTKKIKWILQHINADICPSLCKCYSCTDKYRGNQGRNCTNTVRYWVCK